MTSYSITDDIIYIYMISYMFLSYMILRGEEGQKGKRTSCQCSLAWGVGEWEKKRKHPVLFRRNHRSASTKKKKKRTDSGTVSSTVITIDE